MGRCIAVMPGYCCCNSASTHRGTTGLSQCLVLWGLCLGLGVTGLPMAVMVVAAALPMGANVFLFSQRYGVAQELITASVAVSTALSVLTLTLALMLVS